MRYWRTLCIDYRFKKTEMGKDFPIRVLKLRISRKIMIYSSLLILIMSDNHIDNKIDFIVDNLFLSSLKRLDYLLKEFNIKETILEEIINLYNEFFKNINDMDIRDVLEGINFEERDKNSTYKKIRKIGYEIRDLIKEINREDKVLDKILNIFL